MPVFHKGYLDFFNSHKDEIEKIFLIDTSLVSKLSAYEPDIAALETTHVQSILLSLGFDSEIIDEGSISSLKNKKLLLVNDAVSRTLHELYFEGSDIEWQSVFLRWDQDSVTVEEPCDVSTVTNKEAVFFMQAAYKEAKNSSDWWRQVGAVLVKDGEILLSAYNRGIPTDAEPYQHGAIRDFLEVGVKHELSSTIHSEQLIVALAAQNGVPMKGLTVYVTHFPCAVCAKLLAHSGIKECFFAEGSSNGKGKEVLETAGITLGKVLC
jgi:dCMP deaminase